MTLAAALQAAILDFTSTVLRLGATAAVLGVIVVLVWLAVKGTLTR